jgi:hypothetical protein
MEFYQKLFSLQQEIEAISKDSKNPFFKSNYADINQLLKHLKPLLKKYKLLLIQPILNNEVNAIIQDVGSKERIYSSIKLPDTNDPQKIGGAITYFRRYNIISLLGLESEDDDGNIASNRKVNNKNQYKF